MRYTVSRFLGVATLLALLGGCGFIDYFYLPVPEDTAQELWEAGVENMNATKYYTAAQYFSKLIDRYPFSPYTRKAELSLADARYLNGDYSDAMDAYIEFENMHPRDEEIPYVLYQIGVAAYKTFSTIDRPQTRIGQGVEYLSRLLETYPGSQYAPSARDFYARSRRILAEREIFTADFYVRQKNWGGAWNRYNYIAQTFPDLPEIQDYAQKQAEITYLRSQKKDAQDAKDEAKGGTWKKYFKWL